MLKLQRMLKGANLGDVKVGSTELFQGQERRVIIISTVRSSEDYIGFDRKHNLGFLDNPKRFNVAITRAKALLIIVGNPAVLKHDKHWGALLRLAIDKGAYTGVPPPPDAPDGGGPDGDDDALADRLEQMLIGAEPQGASEQMLQENMEMPDFGV
jgi:helicase MOV-10